MIAYCEGCSQTRAVTRYRLDDDRTVALCDLCHDAYFAPRLDGKRVDQAWRTFTKGLAPR